MHIVIDTNVLIAANQIDCPQANLACVLTCQQFLQSLQQTGAVVIDRRRLILSEYGNKVYPNRARVGDKFLKWLLINQGNPKYCTQIDITPHPIRQFVEFPDDPALAQFDPSDHKFVAVAIACPPSNGNQPSIYNAVDSDWQIYGAALKRYVTIVELCPHCLKS
jgi:hypothetical protein